MKCPHCNIELFYDEEVDSDYIDEDIYYVTWDMICPECNYTRRLHETYKIESREWDEDEECNS